MKICKKTLSALTALTALGSVCAGSIGSLGTVVAAEPTTAIDIVEDMGLGTNLGNTFDAWGHGGTKVETAWGNSVTTQAMIDEIHNYGFDSIRIPVTWYEFADASTYEIDDAYIARVKEVIDYCYNNDMYVIMDMHWDAVNEQTAGTSNWLNAGLDALDQFKAMWTDIANNFNEYDNHLVFQSMNEVRWFSTTGNPYTDDDYNTLNTLNQAFVDVVRATGGNNADRLLLLAGADADLSNTCNAKYIVPDDDMVAVDIHYYNPSTFCVAETDSTWGYSSTWGTDAEKSEVINGFNKLKSNFVDKGVPVIIGEYGVVTAEGKEKDSMLAFLETVAGNALSTEGIAAFLWDDGDSGSMEYFSRNQLKFHDEDFGQLFIDLAGNGYTPPTIDWVEVELTTSDNGKTVFQIGTADKFKLEFTSDLASPLCKIWAQGSVSYWDNAAGKNVQSAIPVAVQSDDDGNVVCSELDADGAVVQYDYINVPAGVSPANVYVEIYWGGYNTYEEDGTYITWTDMTSDEIPTFVKAYIPGVVEDSEPATDPTTEPTTEPVEDVLYGDADLDGTLTINDAVKVMSYVTNKEAYPLTEEQMDIADVYQRGDGLGNMDALAIQKKVAQLISSLPESNLE
ncbi:MAG: cellulase family glycosylhydrolase [Ruminococcus sp.]|nr:cellulase family glycosylhydrolase [Ruminococcus sp.]